MTGRRSRTAWTSLGMLLMALTAVGPQGPIAHATDPAVEPSPSPLNQMQPPAQDAANPDNSVDPQEPTEPQPPDMQPADAETQPGEDQPADNDSLSPPDIHVNAQGRVEMHVRNLDLAAVLQMLSMQARKNIVASKKVAGTVTANLYNVTFAEGLTAILDGNNATWRERGNFIYVYSNEELASVEAAAAPLTARLFRLHYVRAGDVQPMVSPLLSKDGKITVPPAVAAGIATSKEQAGGDSMTQEDCLIVTDYPPRLECIAKLIAELDVRPRQVLIEATILRALLNEDNSLGIDFNLLRGVDFQALAEESPGSIDVLPTEIAANRIKSSSFAVSTDFRAQVPNGGFTFGFIKHDVGMFIRALEQVTDTTVLANPKILTLNKQRGEVIVGRRDGYLTTTVTQTAAVQSVEFLETGTRLIFRPFIGDDGYIRMEVHPEDSTGGVTAANLPYEQTTEVTTNIMVRDGHTILIGGLFRELTTAAKEQLPVAGNIPLAGALFRSSHDTTQREEIVILLTVHVIKDDQALCEASTDAINDVELLRAGMRKGVQWFGRERLAQAHYRWAVEHLKKDHLGRAMWDLDMAINNNPKFLAALQLKEDLLARREWDEDASLLRGFVIHQIQREQGNDPSIFGRPDVRVVPPELCGPSGFDEPPDGPGPRTIKPPTTAPANGDQR